MSNYDDWWGQADLFDPPYVYKHYAEKAREEKAKKVIEEKVKVEND